MTDKLILINLLVKLGVAASVASVLARASTFRRLFFAEHRRPRQTLALLAFFLVPLTLGVWIRTAVPNFLAADISFEAVILLGLLVGPGWAMLGGMVLAAPAVHHGEYLALPFNAAVGLLAGALGGFLEPEEIWSFTPFIDLSLYRWVKRILRRPRVDRQFLMLFLIVAAEASRTWLAHAFPHKLFALVASQWWLQVLVWFTAPIVVGIALKVWNALRIEMKLGRAEAAGAGGAARCAAAADQSALSVQHAELDRVAGAHQARAGAGDDGEACQHSARVVEGPRHVCSAAATS